MIQSFASCQTLQLNSAMHHIQRMLLPDSPPRPSLCIIALCGLASELPNCASWALYCQERLVNLLELTWEGPGLLDRKELGSSSPSLGRLEMQHMAEGVTPPLHYIAGFEVRLQEVPQQGRRWAL